MTTQWFETFFQGFALECWDRCMPPEATKAEVDFLVDALACKPGARILDIPCGSGRHSVELATRGYKLTGIDISRENIDAARPKNPNVDWICADMRTLDRKAEFDAAFCFGNSFGYLEHEDTKKFLVALSRALKPGSRFVLQTGPAEVILRCFQEREWWDIGDMIAAQVNRYVPEKSCVETTYTFIRDGKMSVRPGRQFVYTTAEIQRMLSEVGLKPIALFGGPDKKPFELGPHMPLFVTEKN